MAKNKEEMVEELPEEVVSEPETPRVTHDFHREDLNDLRDAVNELFARG